MDDGTTTGVVGAVGGAAWADIHCLVLTTSNEHIQLYIDTHEHICGHALHWPNNYCMCTHQQHMHARVTTLLNKIGKAVPITVLFGVARAAVADDDGTPYAMRHVYIAMDEYCYVNDTSNECTHDTHLSGWFRCRLWIGLLLRE